MFLVILSSKKNVTDHGISTIFSAATEFIAHLGA
jgi:hypothetical protein